MGQLVSPSLFQGTPGILFDRYLGGHLHPGPILLTPEYVTMHGGHYSAPINVQISSDWESTDSVYWSDFGESVSFAFHTFFEFV